MKVVHSNINPENEQAKKVPLYKNRVAIEAGKIKAILENNERLRKSKQA